MSHPVLLLLFALALGIAPGVARAQAPGKPQAAPVLEVAVAAAPTLTAARARVEAARARFDASGRLPDPELEVMASRSDMPDDNTTMWELNLRQPLAKAGERAADRRRARAAVAMAEAEFAMLAGETAMDVAMAQAEGAAAERRIALLEAQVARMESVLASVDSRLAAGAGRLADRLTVQTRIASMRLMIEEERRMDGDARSEIAARLGAAAAGSLPGFAAPAPEVLEAAHAPATRLAEARASEADAMKAMARAGGRPMTAVGVRLEREQTRMGNEDVAGLAFMTEIPWRSRRYARAEERAANAEVAAARADGVSARLRIEAAIARAERAARLAATARELGRETRARLDAEFEALLGSSAAGGAMAGESAVLMIVEILEKVTETELQVINAEAQADVARAALWPHAPVSLWSEALNSTTTPSKP